MQINGANVRRLYESFCDPKSGTAYEGTKGPAGFVRQLHDMVGLKENADGRRYCDTEKRVVEAAAIPLAELAYAVLGPNAHEILGGRSASDWTTLQEQTLREDGTSAVMPSQFLNISAWNVAVAGMLEVMVLENYQRHSFIGDQLARTIPTRLRQQKMIGHSIIGDLAEEMKPGQRHPRAQFGERYVETPLTKKRGLAIEVTHEAVFFDATNGGVIEMANEVGKELGLRKERLIIDQFIGVTDVTDLNRYTYGGTAYDTYQTASPWINDHSNPFNDWQDVDDARQLFAGMVDMEKGEPIMVEGRDVLFMPGRELESRMVFSYDKLERTTQSGTEIGHGSNPLRSMGYNLLPTSQLVYNRIVAADGLNVSASNAREYWFVGDFKRAFAYMENWAIQTKRANPSDYDMADQDLVLAIFCNEMGTPATIDPHFVVRNKN